jgi:2-polyprenyl-3-methyl-5-hydroxy-6-metoxy-1,4-benzoquinol methylase
VLQKHGIVNRSQARNDASESDRDARERAFWDDRVPSLEECLVEYEDGPDPLTAALLDALEPLTGARVLDFACGTGILAAWLAQRGALVTGVDLSPEAIGRASELASAVGAGAMFLCESLESAGLEAASFDRLAGRFALHHVDCATVAPALAWVLRPGGTGAFLETMDSPLLRLARRHLVGRFGIARFGTVDEQPLSREDLRVIEAAFGRLEVRVPQMIFLRLLDRQVLRYRSAHASRALGRLDDVLHERLHLGSWSYQQLVVVERSA